MPFTLKEENRKSELTSIIDVVFLLLIFFLVTLNVTKRIVPPGTKIKVIQKEITTNETGSPQKVHAVIQILNIVDSEQKYAMINSKNIVPAKNIIAQKINNNEPDSSSNWREMWCYEGYGAGRFYNLNQLADSLSKIKRVSIRADHFCPIEDIIKLYDLLIMNNISVYWSLGNIDELKNIKIKENPDKFIENYEN